MPGQNKIGVRIIERIRYVDPDLPVQMRPQGFQGGKQTIMQEYGWDHDGGLRRVGIIGWTDVLPL